MKFSKMIILVFGLLLAQNGRTADFPANMAQAANGLLASLNANQTKKAAYAFKSEARTDWNFLPAEMLKDGYRKGLQIKEMTPAQRKLAHTLLKTVLSETGHTKIRNIMFLEDILFVLEGKNRRFVRDSEAYHILIFGKPGSKGTWGWRFEGHHLSLNYTIVNGQLAGVPSFWGSNPAICDFGPGRRLVALEAEENLARKLRLSLGESQKKSAVIANKAPKDILTAALPSAKALEQTGVAYGQLDKAGQQMLVELIKEYINRHRAIVAKEDWAKIEKGGLEKIRFSWAGSTKQFEPHYYRVQGPSFLLEYANTQNGANHVHATWRDFNGDFGRDLLREHVRKDH